MVDTFICSILAIKRHGEVEYLGRNIFDLHWYIEADDAVWHFVSTKAT